MTTIEIWVQVSQIVATFLTGVGVIGSLWIGINALKEVKHDRLERIRPKLSFNLGAQVVSCELAECNGIPGIDPEEAEYILSGSPPDAKCPFPLSPLNGIYNLGSGPAVNTVVYFIAEKITTVNSTFSLKESGGEKKYARDYNTFPTIPAHVMPGKQTAVYRIPTPIYTDFERKYKVISGRMEIECNDIDGKPYTTVQPVEIFVDYNQNNTVDLTFSFRRER